MKKFYLLLVALFIVNVARTQSCLPEGITFTTQEQIDNFQTNYPGCTEIEGDVQIGEPYASTDITNLNGLSVLNAIGDSLFIINNPLTSLSGLENLNYIGGSLLIGHLFWGCQGNNALVNLAGLNGLDSIGGDLDIDCNQGMTSLTGLENLIYIGGSLKIGNVVYLGSGGNPSLTTLSGLNNLTSVEGSLIIGRNSALTSLTGLESLTSLQGGIYISYSAGLINLTGLENLSFIGGWLSLYNNSALVSLSGLDNIDSIAGGLTIGDCFQGGTQPHGGNEALASLNALGNITKIGGSVNIGQNNSLKSLSGLQNINAGSITDLEICNNDSLSTCEVQSICEYLSSPNGSIYIHLNATGCNSQQEVEAKCGVGVDENAPIERHINIFPNPSSTQITISKPTTPQKNTTLTIIDITGKLIITRQITEKYTAIDVSGLPQGVYFVKVTDDGTVQVGKIIRQ